MSVAEICTPGTLIVDKQYLPPEATVIPTLVQVLVAGNDGAGNDIENIGNLRINDSEVRNTAGPLTLVGTASAPQGYPDPTVLVGGGSYLQINDSEIRMFDSNLNMNKGNAPAEIILDAKNAIVASFTSPDMLELVAVSGSTVVVSNKINTGQIYDAYFNKPQSAIQLTGTNTTPSPGFAIPASNVPAPAKTLATFDISSLGANYNSFVAYISLNPGAIENPDSATCSYQFWLSDTLDADYDSTKGIQSGFTGLYNYGAGSPGPVALTTLNLRTANPTTTLYLNVKGLATSGGPIGGTTWTNASWTIDIYASRV